MSEHITEWLNAYLDGELRGNRLRQVEDHLENCPDCQAELEALSDLSALLHADPLPEAFPPASRFAAQVALRLPAQPAPRPARNSAAMIAWWLAPVGLLAAWAFVQTVFLLSNWVAAASSLGVLGEAGSWLNTAPSGSSLLAAILEQSGILQGEMAALWNGLESFLAWRGLEQWLWQLPIALLFLGWLAGWLALRNRQRNSSFVQS